MRNRKKAFTLIELLVVVAIIAILVAILLPALSSARLSAQNVACSSNLRQWGLGFAMYTDDYNGWLPWGWGSGSDPVWCYVSVMGKYLAAVGSSYDYPAGWGREIISNGIAVCPADAEAKANGVNINGKHYGRSYSYNNKITTPGRPVYDGVKFKSFEYKDKLAVLADANNIKPSWAGIFSPGWAHYFFTEGSNFDFARHSKQNDKTATKGLAYVLLGDWHVAIVRDSHNDFRRVYITGSDDLQ